MRNEGFARLRRCLEESFSGQDQAACLWHAQDPERPLPPAAGGKLEALGRLILEQHRQNFLLWHVEDSARRTDVDDSVIAGCKRSIDELNQRRNDLIEAVDDAVAVFCETLPPAGPGGKRNTETLGMAIDRLSILALKIYHMREQAERRDAEAAHRDACSRKLTVLIQQRDELSEAVYALLEEYRSGTKKPFLYRQFKMYNDPSLNPELYAPSGKKP